MRASNTMLISGVPITTLNKKENTQQIQNSYAIIDKFTGMHVCVLIVNIVMVDIPARYKL